MEKNLGKRHLLKPLAGLMLMGILTWAALYWDLSQYIHLERIRLIEQRMGLFGPLAFIGFCMTGVMLHLPGIVLIAIGGVLFGGMMGFVLGWVGSLAGSICSFLIARYFIRESVQRTFISRFKPLQALDERLERKGFQTVLALRFVLFLAPPLNWTIGVSRVRFSHYVSGSALGIIPCLAVTSYAADSITRADSFTGAFTPEVLFPAALAFCLVALSLIIAKKLFR